MGLRVGTMRGPDGRQEVYRLRLIKRLKFCRTQTISWDFLAQIREVRWPSWPADKAQRGAWGRRLHAETSWEGR